MIPLVARGDNAAALANELRVVFGQLVRRLRAEGAFPVSHGAVLGRLDRDGPMSVSDLARAERMRPQSMAQTVKDMEAAGLVSRRDDPDDRRRALVELTPDGRSTLDEQRRHRAGWLAKGIAEDLTRDERRQLADALELMRRLAAR